MVLPALTSRPLLRWSLVKKKKKIRCSKKRKTSGCLKRKWRSRGKRDGARSLGDRGGETRFRLDGEQSSKAGEKKEFETRGEGKT